MYICMYVNITKGSFVYEKWTTYSVVLKPHKQRMLCVLFAGLLWIIVYHHVSIASVVYSGISIIVDTIGTEECVLIREVSSFHEVKILYVSTTGLEERDGVLNIEVSLFERCPL